MATTVVIPNPLPVSGSIKLVSEIDGNHTTVGAGTVTLFTVPADQFAIVSVAVVNGSGTTGYIVINGFQITPNVLASTSYALSGVYVGPGRSLQIAQPSGGSGIYASAAGVLFTSV